MTHNWLLLELSLFWEEHNCGQLSLSLLGLQSHFICFFNKNIAAIIIEIWFDELHKHLLKSVC